MKFAQQLFKWFAARPSPRVPAAVPAPLMLALEPRIVYEASVAAVPVAHHAEASHHHADHAAGAKSSTVPGEGAVPGTGAGSGAAGHSESEVNHKTQRAVTATQSAQPEIQVVFVDPNVTGYQTLLAGLPTGTQVVMLNGNTDGFAQIAQYLEQHPGVDAIHLLSHGAEGDVQAGAAWLDPANFSKYSAELAQIGAAMAPGGDFLIYGCDVAEGADGRTLVQEIAAATHLNVAASTDLTGAASLGGNWTLEYQVGNVHTPAIFSAAAEQQYGYLLTQTIEDYTSAQALSLNTGDVTTFNLDNITYTYNVANDTVVGPDANLQALADESASSQSLVVNDDGVSGLTSMTISMQDGKPFKMSSLDIDIVTDTNITIEANGSATNDIVIASNGSFVTETVNLAANSAFNATNSITIAFQSEAIVNLGHLVYQELTPPTVTTTGGATTFTSVDSSTQTPVAVDSGASVSDTESGTINSATVQITGNLDNSQDRLSFTNTSSATYGSIFGSYNASSGTLTLSGTATTAQYQAALDAVTYLDTSGTPNTLARTISFSVNDGIASSNIATKTLDVKSPPIVTTTGGTMNYVGGGTALAVDSGVTVSDPSQGTQASGSVSIGSGFHSGDTLSFSNTNNALYGNIGASYNAGTGVLSLSSTGGSATDAQWANAFDAVAFASSSTTYGNRTISFTVNDGTDNSVAATKTVDVLNPSPVVTADSGSASFVAGDNVASTPVAVDSGLTVTDPGSATLASATVAITGNFHSGEDVLAFTNTSVTTFGNIGGSYNASTGVLTLTSAGATATVAQWQAALETVKYTDTAVTPNNATRTISFTVADNTNTSNTATRTVTVADTDQTPIVTTTGGTTRYAGGASAVPIDGGVTVSDLDNTTQSSGTVSITSGFHSGDTLSFLNTSATLYGNIIASYNSGTGVLTLSSSGATATDAQWANALSAVAFSSSSTTYGNRTVSFGVNDGTENSAAATDTVDVLNPAPVVTADSGSAAFVAGDNVASTPVAVDSGLTVTDGNSATLASATVAITGNFHSGEDALAFTNNGSSMGNITGSYDAGTGVLTLTSASATATVAQWQAALETVTYTDTAITPNNATRTISSTVSDGVNTSNTATRTVTVADTDQTPIVTTTGGTTNYTAGGSALTIDGGVTVSDRDNTSQSSGTVSITSGFNSGDTLSFTNTSATLYGNINASYNSGTGVLTLSSSGATATDAQWANALSAVAFSASSSATLGNRTVSFAVNDGTQNSAVATDTVDVLGPPTVTTDSGSAAFVAGDNVASTPVAIDSGLTVTDGSSATLASATVSITGNFHSGEDMLAFTNDGSMMGNIAGSYNAGTGVLTLTSAGSSATLAQWQAALDAISYTDTAITPNNATRTVSFSVTDIGSHVSNTATRNVTVADTDQTPIVTTTGGTTNYVGGTSAARVDSGVTVSDLDNTTQSSGTVSITGGFHSGDTLSFTNTSATLYGNIVASYNSATGVLTLTSSGATAADAQWANAFDAVSFSAGVSATPGNRTVSFEVNDGTENSAVATKTVDVLSPPTVTTDSGAAAFVAGDNVTSTPVAIDSGLTVTDGSSSSLASATVSITGNFQSGEDVLAFSNTIATTFGNIASSYDATTGVLTLTSSGSSATLAQWKAALDAVTYTDTAITPNTATRTVSFTVTDAGSNESNTATRTVTVADTDQTPIVTTTTGATSFVSGDNTTSTPVVVDPGVDVSDRDNATLASATVSITGGFQSSEDALTFNADASTMGNITGSYNTSTGVLSLSSAGASATLAQWREALDSILYTDNAVTPNNTTRTISFTVNDGSESAALVTKDVSVTATDQTPIANGGGKIVTYVDQGNGGSPVSLDPGVTLSDRDNATLTTAVVAVSGGFVPGQDVLSFTGSAATGNISGSFNATTGVLTLTSNGGAATLAQWEAVFESIAFSESGHGAPGARTITFTVSDGIKTSKPIATTVDVEVASTPQTTVTSPDQPAAVSHAPGEGTLANVPPPVERADDSGSNPLIVLDELDHAPAIGATPALPTITFTDPSAPHAHFPVDHTSVPAVSPGVVFDASEPGPSMFEPIPVVVDINAVPDRPFSLNLSNVLATVDGMRLNAASDVSLQLADGRPLPAWLHYDAATGALSGVLPPRAHNVRIVVQQRDAAGNVTRNEIVLAPSGQQARHSHAQPAPHAARNALTHVVGRATAQAPLPAGKPSLAQQLAHARAALHVVRPVAAATAPAAAAVPEHRA